MQLFYLKEVKSFKRNVYVNDYRQVIFHHISFKMFNAHEEHFYYGNNVFLS